jgi:hypothetical protein
MRGCNGNSSSGLAARDGRMPELERRRRPPTLQTQGFRLWTDAFEVDFGRWAGSLMIGEGGADLGRRCRGLRIRSEP